MSRSWQLFLRDMVHAYFALENATLWKIIRTDVPELLMRLEQIERELR